MSNSLEKIGSNIRLLRTQNELSQQGLAERAGISYKYLGEIERGQVNLSVEVLMKIAQSLNTEPGKILAPSPSDTEELSKAKFMLSELSPKNLSIALALIQVLQKHSET